MTSSVTISAHPVAPNNVVEVNIYNDGQPGSQTQNFVLQDGALQTFNISGGQFLHVRETFTTVVAAYLPPEPPVDPAPSTTG